MIQHVLWKVVDVAGLCNYVLIHPTPLVVQLQLFQTGVLQALGQDGSHLNIIFITSR